MVTATVDFEVPVDATVVLSANASDPDGHPIVVWLWTLEPPPGSAASLNDSSATMPWFVADVEGDYVATVKVRDPYEWSDPDTVIVTAVPAPKAYGISISASDTDPHVNTGMPSGEESDLYLWLEYLNPSSDFGYFEGKLTVTGPWTIISFTEMNGFWTMGSASQLMLLAPGCLTEPVVMGRIRVLELTSGEMCMTETSGGDLYVEDCSSQVWDVQLTGYAADGWPPCCVNCTDVTGAQAETVPQAARLYAAYPNPFNPQTTIRFDLPTEARTTLALYSVSGRRVKTLVDEHRPAGSHTVVWDGRDGRGRQTASGVYFYRLEAAGYTETKKMVLLR